MADPERLAGRLAAVERAITDADVPPADLADAAAVTDRLETLEDRVEALDDQVTELSAGLRALRGYVGNVDTVDEAVERRADAALAAVDRLEARAGRGAAGATGDALDRSTDDAIEFAADGRGWVDAGAMAGRTNGNGSTGDRGEATDDGVGDAGGYGAGWTGDAPTADGTRGPGWTPDEATSDGRAGDGTRNVGAMDQAVQSAVTGAAGDRTIGDRAASTTNRAGDGERSGGRGLLDRLREVL